MDKTHWKLTFTVESLILFILVICILNKAGILFNNVDIACAANINSPCSNNIDIIERKSIDDAQENNIHIATEEIQENPKNIILDENSDIQLDVKSIKEKYKDKIKKTYKTNVTSYNSEVAQTDSSPCITASGLDVCQRGSEDIVATNDLPLHTKILIPEYFGEKIFYVEDRMNVRYTGTGRVDIWMQNKNSSQLWGIKYTEIVVLK